MYGKPSENGLYEKLSANERQKRFPFNAFCIFRTILVHDYRTIDNAIVITHGLQRQENELPQHSGDLFTWSCRKSKTRIVSFVVPTPRNFTELSFCRSCESTQFSNHCSRFSLFFFLSFNGTSSKFYFPFIIRLLCPGNNLRAKFLPPPFSTSGLRGFLSFYIEINPSRS